jgi:hypothetical protein
LGFFRPLPAEPILAIMTGASQRGDADLADEPSSHKSLRLVPANDGPAALSQQRLPGQVGFDRLELMAILNLYGRKVANGEWRDYAMDFLKDRALFSIYRRNSERPLYVIEKNPKLRQGPYLVTNQDGRILKRGHELANVLRVLEPQLAVVK